MACCQQALGAGTGDAVGCTGTAGLGWPAARRPMHASAFGSSRRESFARHMMRSCAGHTPFWRGRTQAGPKPLAEALASGAAFWGFAAAAGQHAASCVWDYTVGVHARCSCCGGVLQRRAAGSSKAEPSAQVGSCMYMCVGLLHLNIAGGLTALWGCFG